jgi:hypothetical protein
VLTEAVIYKVCSRCREEKALDEFGIDRSTSDSRHSQCRKCKNARRRLRRTAEVNRKDLLWQRYRLTIDDYNKMFEKQEGRCAICKRQRPYLLLVDHCHKTHRVRGLLCKICNTFLAYIHDDPSYVVEYFEFD